jgi:endoglucanase
MSGLLTLTLAASVAAAAVPDIRVDQAGYLPGAPKVALVVSRAAGDTFVVRRAAEGSSAFQGRLGPARDDPDSGDRVLAADFSALREPGTYYLEVPGVGRSWEFAVGEAVYSRVLRLSWRWFYGQRCGTAVDLAPEFPGYTYPACHLQGAYHPSSGREGPRASVAGWHDAGDYGRYTVNSGITTGTLLWAWELFGPRLKDLDLQIPESGNGSPDVLDEARWNLEWMLSLQDEDGGLWHKQTSERFPGFVMPEKDTAVSAVIGTGAAPFNSSCATGDFAAVAAIAGRVYAPFDAAFARRSLEASRRAWQWLERNPEVPFRNPAGVQTGEYGDASCGDERLWAAAELWRTTGEAPFQRHFLDRYAAHRGAVGPANPPAWPNVAPLALWAYALRGGDDVAASLRDDAVRAADQIVERTARHPYRISLTTADYVWGSNGVAANYGMQLLVAGVLRPDPRYQEAALENLHYLLGRNPFSLSWVTRVGASPYRFPHHRPSGADANPEPWPGGLSGGPNAARQDPVLQKLPSGPPARAYADEEASYASNEVAINWNAPLAFLLAGVAGPPPAGTPSR